jgi:hypothetical protein
VAEEQIGSGRRSVLSVPASDERKIGKALRQVPALNAAFQSSAEEVARARAVLRVLGEGRRAGRGAVRLDGDLVDEAMAVGARRVLAKARA